MNNKVKHEEIGWLFGCTICNDAVVKEVKRLQRDKVTDSVVGACRMMADRATAAFPELQDNFTEGALRGRYERQMKKEPRKPSTKRAGEKKEPATDMPGPAEMPESVDDYAVRLIEYAQQYAGLLRTFSGEISSVETKTELSNALAGTIAAARRVIKITEG